jgi:hypothetical protein
MNGVIRITKSNKIVSWYNGRVGETYKCAPIATEENMYVCRFDDDRLWLVRKGDYEFVEREETVDEIQEKKLTEADMIFEHLSRVSLTITHFQQFDWTDDEIKAIIRELFHKFRV